MFGIIKEIVIKLLTDIVPLMIQNVCREVIKNLHLNLLLLIHNLMNILKDYLTIHLHLSYMNVLEAVKLLMTYLRKYVFQTKQKV